MIPSSIGYLVAKKGSITDFDENVDEHPEGDAGAKDGDRDDHQTPRPADERLVRVSWDRVLPGDASSALFLEEILVLPVTHLAEDGLADGPGVGSPVVVDAVGGGEVCGVTAIATVQQAQLHPFDAGAEVKAFVLRVPTRLEEETVKLLAGFCS